MKKLIFIISLLMNTVSFAQSFTAEWEKPTVTEFVDMADDGKTTQFLRNVGAKGFFVGHNDWNTRASVADYGDSIRMKALDGGTWNLGCFPAKYTDYTLTITRNDAEQVLLTDSETGKTIDLTEGSYRFHARKGTYNNRLMLTFGTVTGMDDVRWTMDDEQWSMYDERCTMYDGPCGEAYYDLSGRRIGKPTKAGVYLLKNGKRVQKVLVK